MKLDGGGPGRGILREIYGLGTGQADRSAGPFYGCRSVSGKGVIRPGGLGDRSYTPDFESGRVPGEKLRKADKTLGIAGFRHTKSVIY